MTGRQITRKHKLWCEKSCVFCVDLPGKESTMAPPRAWRQRDLLCNLAKNNFVAPSYLKGGAGWCGEAVTGLMGMNPHRTDLPKKKSFLFFSLPSLTDLQGNNISKAKRVIKQAHPTRSRPRWVGVMDDALVLDNYSIHHAPGACLELLIYLSNVFKLAKKISIDLAGLCVVWKIFFLSPLHWWIWKTTRQIKDLNSK